MTGKSKDPRPNKPQPDDEPKKKADETRPVAPYNVPESGGKLPDTDEGPPAEPLDEVQAALFEAAQTGSATELDLDKLPSPDLDEGPGASPVDEVQAALFDAAQQGLNELQFDQLPQPSPTRPQKVIKFKKKGDSKPTTPTDTKPNPAPEPSKPTPAPHTRPVHVPDPVLTTAADFGLLLTVFLSFRVLTLFLLRPGGFVRDWSEFNTFFGIASLSDYGLYPFLDFWLEWPPLGPWLVVGSYQASLWLPPWPEDPRLGFVVMLGLVFVLFEVGNFVLVYRIASRLFRTEGVVTRVLWLYAGLFPPVYAMLGFFDGVALFFMLLTLDLLMADRRFLSAMAVGVGFTVKIVPILMLPVAVRRLWYTYRTQRHDAWTETSLYTIVAGLTVLALMSPFIIMGPEWVLAFLRAMADRSAWETVWALLEGYYGFGQVMGDRFNPNETNFAIYPGTLPWSFITLLFAGLYSLMVIQPGHYNQPRQTVALAGLTVCVFFLYTKGYSPQFLVYLLPFVILLFPDIKGLTYALILTVLNILEQPVYFVMLPDAEWLLTFVIIARYVTIILLAVEFGWALWPAENPARWFTTMQKYSPWAIGGVAAFALLIVGPYAMQAYGAQRLTDSPDDNPSATFVKFMQVQELEPGSPRPYIAKPLLLVSDQTVYRQVYPYLANSFEVQLTAAPGEYAEALPTVSELIAGQDRVWILPTGERRQRLLNPVDNQAELVAAFEFAALGTARLYQLEGRPRPYVAPVRLAGGIELLAHRVEVLFGAVEVELFWRSTNDGQRSYTVFTQLLTAEGEWAAGHDSIPGNGQNPTDQWPLNTIQADLHRIELPPDLPMGEYTLVVGMYNQLNQRLDAVAPGGDLYANRAVPLENIRFR